MLAYRHTRAVGGVLRGPSLYEHMSVVKLKRKGETTAARGQVESLPAAETTRNLHFVGMPPGTILLTPISTRIERWGRRPW